MNKIICTLLSVLGVELVVIGVCVVVRGLSGGIVRDWLGEMVESGADHTIEWVTK